MDVGDDGVAMDMGGDGIAEEPPDSATSLSNMLDRIDSQVSNVGRFPESDSESEPTALADGRYDDPEESPLGNHGGIDEAIFHADDGVPPDAGAASTQPPRLENIHTLAPSYASSFILEGGHQNLRFNTKAAGSRFYPFSTKEELMLFSWQHTHQISQKALGGLIDILLSEDEGCGFDVEGLRGVEARHFFDKMRKFLPLLTVLGREVPSTLGGVGSATVYDVPLNLLIDRDMRLASETGISASYPAGKVLRGNEAEENCFSSDHINCVPTLPKGNVVKSNMHGTLARSTPFFGIDGVKTQFAGRKVYVHDVGVCDIDGTPSPCRILELYWDEERMQAMASISFFRNVTEVRDVGDEEKRRGLLRVWEETPAEGKLNRIPVSAILDLCEIYTVEEVQAGQHTGDWDQGLRSSSWGAYVGEGFVRAPAKRRRRGGRGVGPKPQEVYRTPWNRQGTSEEPLFSVRAEGFHLNDSNKLFFSAPVTYYNDAFNCWGMGNKVCMRRRNDAM